MVLLRCNGWVGTGSGHDQLLRDPPVDFLLVGCVLELAVEDDQMLVPDIGGDPDHFDVAPDVELDIDRGPERRDFSPDAAAFRPLPGDTRASVAGEPPVEVAHVWQS